MSDSIDIYYLYTHFLSYVNTFQGGWYRPTADFEPAVNDIQNEIWEEYTADAEKSTEIKDNLRNWLKSKPIVVKPEKGAYGFFLVPDDYGRRAATRIITDFKNTVESCDPLKTDEEQTQEYYSNMSERTLKVIDNNKWSAVLEHRFKFPTLKDPKMTQIEGGFRVAPREISVVHFDYYIKPTPVKFAYDKTEANVQTGAGDQLIYNKLKSKQLLWPSTMSNEFIIRLGLRYSLFTRDQFMAQFANAQKNGK